MWRSRVSFSSWNSRRISRRFDRRRFFCTPSFDLVDLGDSTTSNSGYGRCHYQPSASGTDRGRARLVPFPQLEIQYDDSTTEIILFDDFCYSEAFSGLIDGDLQCRHRHMLGLTHRARCLNRCEVEAERWGSPFNFFDFVRNGANKPKCKPLSRCQLQAIARIGGVTTYEFGLRFTSEPGSDTSFGEFCIDSQAREDDRAKVYIKSEVWRDQVTFGDFLLAVPRKVLEFDALEWILDTHPCLPNRYLVNLPDRYFNMPAMISPEKFFSNAVINGMNESEAHRELGCAMHQGIKKSVCVDLRGLQIPRRVLLFLSGEEVDRWRFSGQQVAASEVFDIAHWKQLSIDHLEMDSVGCIVWDMKGTVDIYLCFKVSISFMKNEAHTIDWSI